LDGVIARHLQLGFSVIVRDDDYKNIYGAGPHPKRPVKDTKYGVCFHACLAFVPSFIASELKLVGKARSPNRQGSISRSKAGTRTSATPGGSLNSTKKTRCRNGNI
jgi:hypothetical protein